jgi:galactan 5-O-arabinofuranosyltransferase
MRNGAYLVGAVLVGWLCVWGAADAFNVLVTDPSWQGAIRISTGALVILTGLAVTLVGRRRPAVAAAMTVATTGIFLSGLATWALHGTRWGMAGLRGDSAFRSEAAMRYSDTMALADYAYLDLPAYYPPALGWVEGRLAAVAGIPGWQAVKPVQLVLAAVVPLLAYALWRRLLPPLSAALVVLGTSLLTAHLQKPDEWLVLACAVPWWLDAFRNIRDDSQRRWPPWSHGIVAGLLLLVHTFFFLPLAVATVMGVALDLIRRRPLALPLRQGLLLVAVGLAVSSPYWLGLIMERLGSSSDDLHLRFSFDRAWIPSWPWPDDLAGGLGMAGVVWLVIRARADRMAVGLSLALVAGYVTVMGGAVLEHLDVALLTFKADPFIVSVQAAAGVLGLVDATRHVARRLSRPIAVPTVVGSLLTVLVVSPVALGFVGTWGTGDFALVAHHTRYPSGEWPAGHRREDTVATPAFTIRSDPPVEDVLAAWHDLAGGQDHSATVLVTTRVDLIATTTLHPFVTWKSIYSHPNGQFHDRIDLLQRVAACTDSSCAAGLLRSNPFDVVDGLVLNRRGRDLVMPYEGDNFPGQPRREEVVFPAGLFRPPDFGVRSLGRVRVIEVR